MQTHPRLTPAILRKRRSNIGYFVGAIIAIFIIFFDYGTPLPSNSISSMLLALLILVILINPYFTYNYIKYGINQVMVLSLLVSGIGMFALCFILFQAVSTTNAVDSAVAFRFNQPTVIALIILVLINFSVNLWVYKKLDMEVVQIES